MKRILPWSAKFTSLLGHSKLTNKFVIMLMAFMVWMIFFDKNNIITHYKLYMMERGLKQEKQAYISSIEEVKQAQLDLEEDKERFAREHYYIHRENEDVFIIDKE